jgi:type II secretory ATPase GspE/PulE/Tfp pilus assembly ATPase PilB-like protein
MYRDWNSQHNEYGDFMELEEIVEQGIEIKASDIHFIPGSEKAGVFFRQGERLESFCSLDMNRHNIYLQRVKANSGMNISEKRLPQDGVLKMAGMTIRVSTMKSVNGESLVMRLFDRRDMGIRMLGISDEKVSGIIRHLKEGSGITLIAGETGMGKSTTLYGIMMELRDQSYKVLSVEDPVERFMEGVVQCQINEAAGLTYEKAIFASLRQDPDFICIGEIRNEETARALVRASLTGHRVISTIHGTGYRNVILRLMDFGIREEHISNSVGLVLTQRLGSDEGRRKLDVRLEFRSKVAEIQQGEIFL